MLSYRKIFLFYSAIAILVCGIYLERGHFSGITDPGLIAGFFEKKKDALERKIAETKHSVEKFKELNPIDLNLDEAVPALKIEVEKKIADAQRGAIKAEPETERKNPETALKPEIITEGSPVKTGDGGFKQTDGGNQETEEGAGLSSAGVIELTNRERISFLGAGSELKESAKLDRAAEYRVRDMFSKQYFAHESPEGLKMNHFLDEAGYDSLVSGENLAQGNFIGDADLVSGWMKSPGHRNNILSDNFQEIGAAVGYGMFEGHNTWLAVQFFGTPSSACFAPNEDLANRVDSLKAELEDIEAGLALMSQAIDSMKQEAGELKVRIEELQGYGRYSEAAEVNEALNILIDQINEEVKNYNQKVADQKNIYARYRESADEYNAQVREYNECLDDL
ncbi:MAG TPA: CAP domain-containing protein [Candidatus Paceibacterota bacterium]|nr:CAP domain-containing protein [Candidatus Pacearchaeota archaeon]HRZ50460.1 CAP domain-containing protein [Candidatus Paceibacterota bacterium]HSA36181.1 CAP domain-containing protein [Candidatus Paceibacterota bacterium]